MAVTAGLVKLAARDNDKSDRELAKSEIREDNCEKNNALLRAENNELRKDKVDDLRKLLVFQDSFKNVLKAILKNK